MEEDEDPPPLPGMDLDVLEAVVQVVLAYDARQEEADARVTDPDQLYEALETARLHRLVGHPLPPRQHYRIPGLTASAAGVRSAVDSELAEGDPDAAYQIALDVRSTSHSPARTAAERVRVQAYE